MHKAVSDHDYQSQCLAKRAFRENDPLLCKQGVRWTENKCFLKLAALEKDVSLCHELGTNSSDEPCIDALRCYVDVGKLTHDPSVCEKINPLFVQEKANCTYTYFCRFDTEPKKEVCSYNITTYCQKLLEKI